MKDDHAFRWSEDYVVENNTGESDLMYIRRIGKEILLSYPFFFFFFSFLIALRRRKKRKRKNRAFHVNYTS